MENEFQNLLKPHFEKFLQRLVETEKECSNLLPEIRLQKQKESHLKAQGQLQKNIQSIVESIKLDLKKINEEIFKKKYPVRSKALLIDSFTGSAERQIQLATDILLGDSSDNQILFYLNNFYKMKMFDSLFYLYEGLVCNLKDHRHRENFVIEMYKIIGQAKTELKIDELENKASLYNEFLDNVDSFLRALSEPNSDLGNSLLKELHTDVKRFLKNSFPELYEYIFKKSYPAQV